MGSNKPSPLGAADTTTIKVAIPDEMATVLHIIAVDGYDSRSDLVRMIVCDWLHDHESLWLPESLVGLVEWRGESVRRPAMIGGPLFSEILGQVRVWSTPEMRRIARMFNMVDVQVADVVTALGYPRDGWPTGPNRKAIPNGVRWVVTVRSGGKCEAEPGGVRCGQPAVTMHHVVYRMHGGLNVAANLKHLCKLCHTNEHRDDPKPPKPTPAQILSKKAELRRLKKRLDEPTAPTTEYWRISDRRGKVLGEYPSEMMAAMNAPHGAVISHVILD